MAKVQFKTYTANEIVLFLSNLWERIPKDHPVRLLSRIVDGLDLTELIRTYKSGGTTLFHPRMLLKVVFYAYMNNIYSCRKIEDVMNNGQTKTDKQYKRFRHRGFPKIQMDFGILAMAFNLQKLIKNEGKGQIKAVMEAFSTLFSPLLASLWTLWGKFQKEETSVNKNRQLSNRNLIAA